MLNSDTVVRSRPTRQTIQKFLKQASLSGGIWRPYEIASFSGLKMLRPILDVGCGDGSFVNIVFTKGFDYGLDISEKDLNKAKKNGIYEKYLSSDARNIPLSNHSIKTAFSNSVFEHIKNLEGVLDEINRVLEINGRLVFTTHLLHSQEFNSVKLLRKLKLDSLANIVEKVFTRYLQLNTLWTEEKWKGVLKQKGFQVEYTKVMVSDTSFLMYELFMPFTFLQNRIKILKKIPITKFILAIINIDYKAENKSGYNIIISAKKIKSIK